jgi:chromatin segregation and condensation protein Rec8/ScpA/Scc1 (kleisin family)
MNEVVTMIQQGLDQWFLRQDVIDQLLQSGDDDLEGINAYADRILMIAQTEEAEHQTLEDPFDRSVALVLSLVNSEGLDAWNIDLTSFLRQFMKRVKSQANSLDLPACGRLIRMAWEVLNHQAAHLFERIQYQDNEDDWDTGFDFGWETEYDDHEFHFTNTVLQGNADEVLENLFDERVRRDEGRPVTLGELLSALKDAADDADAQKLREKNRIAHAIELEDMISNVGGRMHNEDLDGDIERCWTALRQTTVDMGSSNVPLKAVIKTLVPILESAFGSIPEGYDEDARVSSFIAGLFLTHKGMASITQGNQLNDVIMIEDLWPQLTNFADVLDATLEADQEAQVARSEAKTGSVLHAERLQERAEKARRAEEKARQKIEEEQQTVTSDFDEHEWLVE